MPRKVEGQLAYVLHSRPYRNTSLILETFTANMGRQTLVARSARGLKSRFQGQLQSFVPLVISYSGQGELKNLTAAELIRRPYDLEGCDMMCGFYLNELLLRLLQKGEEHKALFFEYEKTLGLLEKRSNVELNLRLFEKKLLSELGYAINLSTDAVTGMPIDAGQWYQFLSDQGFVEATSVIRGANVYSGDSLLAFATGDLISSDHFSDAKRLMRQALAVYLGHKPIKSRECL